MGKEHEQEIKEQFRKQATGFSNELLTLNQEDLLTWILDSLDLEHGMSVLDVAGGHRDFEPVHSIFCPSCDVD